MAAHETPATVKRLRSCPPVSTDSSREAVIDFGPAAPGRTRADVAGASPAADFASIPRIGVLVTDGATGRGLSAAAKDTVGRAMKTGVRATARAAERSLKSGSGGVRRGGCDDSEEWQ